MVDSKSRFLIFKEMHKIILIKISEKITNNNIQIHSLVQFSSRSNFYLVSYREILVSMLAASPTTSFLIH